VRAEAQALCCKQVDWSGRPIASKHNWCAREHRSGSAAVSREVGQSTWWENIAA